MATKITAKELKAKTEISLSNDDNILNLFWSEHIGKFITEFNSKFMASSPTLKSPLKKFNELATKHKLN